MGLRLGSRWVTSPLSGIERRDVPPTPTRVRRSRTVLGCGVGADFFAGAASGVTPSVTEVVAVRRAGHEPAHRYAGASDSACSRASVGVRKGSFLHFPHSYPPRPSS